MRRPEPNQIFRHFKGNLYKIITIATHTETQEEMVIYQALYGNYGAYVRPLSMFMEEVDKLKYPEADQQYRFQLLEEIVYHQDKSVELKQPAFTTKETAGREEPVQQEEAASREQDYVQQQPQTDPLLEAYFDAGSCKERLEILDSMSHRITDDMITAMAIVSDFEISEGPLEERLLSLKNCLQTREKYEGTRLRVTGP